MPRLRAGAGRVLGWAVGDEVGETWECCEGQREGARSWWSELSLSCGEEG